MTADANVRFWIEKRTLASKYAFCTATFSGIVRFSIWQWTLAGQVHLVAD